MSVGTVSNSFNRPDSVAPETRARILAVVERLGYVRSESARQLRTGTSRIVALLVLDLANPFFVEVANGAERAAGPGRDGVHERAVAVGGQSATSGCSPNSRCAGSW